MGSRLRKISSFRTDPQWVVPLFGAETNNGPLGSTSSPVSEGPLQAPWRLTQRDLGLAALCGDSERRIVLSGLEIGTTGYELERKPDLAASDAAISDTAHRQLHGG